MKDLELKDWLALQDSNKAGNGMISSFVLIAAVFVLAYGAVELFS